jgi:hypothetical protein
MTAFNHSDDMPRVSEFFPVERGLCRPPRQILHIVSRVEAEECRLRHQTDSKTLLDRRFETAAKRTISAAEAPHG